MPRGGRTVARRPSFIIVITIMIIIFGMINTFRTFFFPFSRVARTLRTVTAGDVSQASGGSSYLHIVIKNFSTVIIATTTITMLPRRSILLSSASFSFFLSLPIPFDITIASN